MKISTRARYGTRAMLDLFLHQADGPVTLKSMGTRQGISPKYLVHLMRRLVASGLVRPVRGPSGGFLASRSAADISLAEIVEALEGRICLVDCGDHPELCNRASFCPTRDVWKEASQTITRYLREITLEELCRRQREKLESHSAMYYI